MDTRPFPAAACIEILEGRIAPAVVAAISLGDLSGGKGFQFSGGAQFDDAGASVSDAGDVNGDGFADLIVGAANATGSVALSGAAYVIFGFGTGAATVSADGKTATFTDVDGDAVTLKSSKGGLTVERLHLSTPNALGGSRLVSADFSDPVFAGSNITLTAKPAPRAGALGDGLANVGSIFAGANALGTVKIDGDLAQLDAGAVKVKGSWTASSFIAGTLAGTDDLFGTADDTAIAGGNAIEARIASITIGGQALGSADAGDHFGIVAQQIGGLKVGKAKAKLTKIGLDVFELLGTGDFTVREVA